MRVSVGLTEAKSRSVSCRERQSNHATVFYFNFSGCNYQDRRKSREMRFCIVAGFRIAFRFPQSSVFLKMMLAAEPYNFERLRVIAMVGIAAFASTDFARLTLQFARAYCLCHNRMNTVVFTHCNLDAIYFASVV